MKRRFHSNICLAHYISQAVYFEIVNEAYRYLDSN